MQKIESEKIEDEPAGSRVERAVTGPDGKPIKHDLYEPSFFGKATHLL